MDRSLYIKAPAKVNLCLEVTGKRPDGYHDLESVFQTISIFDDLVVTISDGEGVFISSNRPDMETPDNLAVRAAHAYKRETDLSGRVGISLVKRIPVQGGLGGGSSDAAAVLVALNTMAAKPLDNDALRRIGAGLGSDVPFFIEGGTALVRGRGELVQPIEMKGKFYFVVYFPGFGVSTAQVYKNLKMSLTDRKKCAMILVEMLSKGTLEDATRYFFNRLELTAYALDERLAEARAAMCRATDDAGVTLCGSGASMFSAFADPNKACRVFEAVREIGQGEVFLAESNQGITASVSPKGDGRGDFGS